ncbi:tetrapyrrole methylase [Cyathus striatus]|nr:tetrapyrrole methylase [Cyathus striatus]
MTLLWGFNVGKTKDEAGKQVEVDLDAFVEVSKQEHVQSQLLIRMKGVTIEPKHFKCDIKTREHPLSATRAYNALESGASVVVLSPTPLTSACEELQVRVGRREIEWVDWGSLSGNDEIERLDNWLQERRIALACVTDTLLNPGKRTRTSAEGIYNVLRVHHVPTSVTDIPHLCDFTFASTHRWEGTPLQVGVTTNGQGCRLGGRIRREIVSRLPKEVGETVIKIGEMRALAKQESEAGGEDVEGEDEVPTPNLPVTQRKVGSLEDEESLIDRTRRRMRYVAQVSEYWPLPRLASLSSTEMHEILSGTHFPPLRPSSTSPVSYHSLSIFPSSNLAQKKGRILLVGSGPGHPSLLTLATYHALTHLADLVLADKLVPSAVLDIIPKHIPIRIARKFPGNAEIAQEEMMRWALEGVREGKCVVRLKQGDPSIYGRSGEEYLLLSSYGFTPLIVPGISSALAGPTLVNIPLTQRGVADSFVVCTGVGRGGKSVQLPGYRRERTLVILMGVARLASVINTLTSRGEVEGRDGERYPPETPIAIIERASMPDQRAILSTLGDVVQAVQAAGEQRPPGMMVIGWAVLALASAEVNAGSVAQATTSSVVHNVLDDPLGERDAARVGIWLGGRKWMFTEGLQGWDVFEDMDLKAVTT